MAELTTEQYEQVPDFLKGDYEQVGDTYQHKAEGKAAALKQSMNSLNDKFNGAQTQINEIEAKRQADIEAAKQQALEEARKSGDWETGEQRYKEMLDDANKRHEAAMAEKQSSFDSLAGTVKASKKEAMLSDFRSKLGVFPESAKLFDTVIGQKIDIDPLTGSAVFLGDDGGATSLDAAGFLQTIESDQAFNHIRKADISGQGGMAQGSNSAGGAHKSLKDMTVSEQVAFANEHPEEYKQQIGA